MIAIRSLTNIVNNSIILGECCQYLDLFSGCLSVTVICVSISGHSNIPGNGRADELAPHWREGPPTISSTSS